MNVIQKLLCVGVVSALATAAFAKSGAKVASRSAISPAEAERIAARVMADDIKAGKINLKQAGRYYVCANETYATSFDAASIERVAKVLGALAQHKKAGTQPGPAEQAEVTRTQNEVNAVMERAEQACMKQLGAKVTPGVVLVRMSPR